MTTRSAVVLQARSQIGVPWLHQAAVPNVAMDCLGLIASTGLVLGMEGSDKWRADQRMRNYTRPPNPRTILTACAEYLDPIAIADIKPADIVLMRFGGQDQHFAIVSSLEPVRIIHAYTSAGRVVETGLGGGWDKRVVRAYRYRGIEEDEMLCREKPVEFIPFISARLTGQ